MKLYYSEETARAHEEGRSLVALESTVITHGLPYPRNLETAQRLEQCVREEGAVPATIAILGGQITIGLEPEQLEQLAREPEAVKCSRRDLPYVVGLEHTGATTVAATMILAHQAGIQVFATGGIGGVHRDAPYDVSADLYELGKTPVTVVCAGAKAILDIPLTLETLETQGVPVIGYGTDDFPAFYSRSSGHPVSCRCNSPDEIAALIQAHRSLGLQNGILVANPISQTDELPSEEAETAIRKALSAMHSQDIRGKEVTPFLLAEVSRLTGEKSLKANVALLASNARLAARIAAILPA